MKDIYINQNPPMHFSHSGDLGDIIASLYTVKTLWVRTRRKAILHINLDGGLVNNPPEIIDVIKRQTNGFGTKLTKAGYDFIRPFIIAQPYIEDVVVLGSNDNIDIFLDSFRIGFSTPEIFRATQGGNLLKLHTAVILNEIPNDAQIRPWCTVDAPNETLGKSVFCRSCRMQSATPFIQIHQKEFAEEYVFVGTDLEYRAYEECVRIPMKRVPVKDALEAAQLIAGGKYFFGNSSLFYWISVALGHPRITLEWCPDIDTQNFLEKPEILMVVGARQKLTPLQMNLEEARKKKEETGINYTPGFGFDGYIPNKEG